MKLLFDENLAPRLTVELAGLFPGSEHVKNIGLSSASDRTIWQYAIENEFSIVSKDADLRQLSTLLGPPPKVFGLILVTVPLARLYRD